MKNTELYHQTIDILATAYFNDTLKHENYCACAVGNIIAANLGIKMLKRQSCIDPNKEVVFWGANEHDFFGGEWYHNSPMRFKEINMQIEATGYSYEEIMRIESAFENAPMGATDEQWMFNGLMSVVNRLDEIHENKDSEITQSAKKKFNKLQTA